MAEVVWLDEAIDQLDAIVLYVRAFDRRAAVRMAERLTSLAASLGDFPERGRPAMLGTRELVTIPPYIIRYELRDGVVTILGVRHGRQRAHD